MAGTILKGKSTYITKGKLSLHDDNDDGLGLGTYSFWQHDTSFCFIIWCHISWTENICLTSSQ